MGRILVLLFSFLICACGLKQTADEVVDTSKDIKKESEHLRKRTDDMERELVNKESNSSVKENLDLLFGEGQYGAQEISEPAMLLYAGYAVEAMHFQFWKGDYYEDMKLLDDFFTQPMEMMFVKATRQIPRHGSVDVMMPDRAYKAVGALAAKLDRLSADYARNLKRKGLKSLSLYDVMVEALRNRGKNERRERLPLASSMVLQWKQEAIYILQMRHNFLPLTVLARMTNFQEQNDILDWKFWDTRLWDAMMGQEVDLRSADPEQLKIWTTWLNQARQTRQDLIDMCIQPEYNALFVKIFKKVKFTGVSAAAKNPELRDFLAAFKAVSEQSVTRRYDRQCTL